jgi:hypothetical protein
MDFKRAWSGLIWIMTETSGRLWPIPSAGFSLDLLVDPENGGVMHL